MDIITKIIKQNPDLRATSIEVLAALLDLVQDEVMTEANEAELFGAYILLKEVKEAISS